MNAVYVYDKRIFPNGNGRLAGVTNTLVATVVTGYDAMGQPLGEKKTTTPTRVCNETGRLLWKVDTG